LVVVGAQDLSGSADIANQHFQQFNEAALAEEKVCCLACCG
jgi:hypothetical protein